MRHASRRQAVLLAALGIAALLAVVLVATSGGGRSPQIVSVTPLLDASYVVTHGPGYQFKMTVTASLEEREETSTFGVEGTIDERGQQGAMTFKAAGHQLAEVYRPPYVYVRSPNGKLVEGKSWFKVNVGALEETFGGGGDTATGSDGPRQFIASLNSAASATLVGHDSVAGEATTHYHALVNLKRYATTVSARERVGAERYAAVLQQTTGATLLPVDVWVGSQDRLRRYQTKLRLCSPEGIVTYTTEFEILNYGPEPAVQIPAPSETKDITDTVGANASKELRQLSCR